MKPNHLHQSLAFDHFFKTRIVYGMVPATPTNASTQATGTGASDFNVDFKAVSTGSPAGLILVDGKALQVAAQADFDVAASAAQQMASGQSRIYTIIAFLNKYDQAVTLKSCAGAAATTGSQIALTDAEIDALLAPETVWMRICNVTVNRTGDTTVTQSYDTTVRELQREVTYNTPS